MENMNTIIFLESKEYEDASDIIWTVIKSEKHFRVILF